MDRLCSFALYYFMNMNMNTLWRSTTMLCHLLFTVSKNLSEILLILLHGYMHFSHAEDGLSIGQPWKGARSTIRKGKKRRQRSNRKALIPTENAVWHIAYDFPCYGASAFIKGWARYRFTHPASFAVCRRLSLNGHEVDPRMITIID